MIGRPESYSPNVEQLKIEKMYRIVLADKPMIQTICRGDIDLCEEIISRMSILFMNSSVEAEDFEGSFLFRKKIYKNILVDILREKNKDIQRSLYPDEDVINNIPQEVSEEADTIDAMEKLEQEVDKILHEVESKISDENLVRMYIFLHDRIRGKFLKSTAEKLNLSESRMNQIVLQFRKNFPEYEYFFEPLFRKDKNILRDQMQQKNTQLNLEHLTTALSALQNKEDLSNYEKAAILLAEWYLDPTKSKEDLDEKIVQLGIDPHNPRNMRHCRNVLEKAINYVPINWMVIVQNRRRILLHTKSKV